MALIKTSQDIEVLREGGRRLARVLRMVAAEAKPGVSTKKLDGLAERLIREGGDEPAFLNYLPPFAKRAFPATLCVSVNDEVVHGIPTENDRELKEGDIVSLDCGLKHEGLFVDSAITVPVGAADEKARELMETTEKALLAGIEAAHAGNRLGDVGHAIESVAKSHGFGVVTELCGHGVGHKVHEEPQVPNFGDPGTGLELKVGMVLALEPMLNVGSPDVKFLDDGYTVVTADGKRSAHFEHTIAILEKGPEILTKE